MTWPGYWKGIMRSEYYLFYGENMRIIFRSWQVLTIQPFLRRFIGLYFRNLLVHLTEYFAESESKKFTPPPPPRPWKIHTFLGHAARHSFWYKMSTSGNYKSLWKWQALMPLITIVFYHNLLPGPARAEKENIHSR